MTLDEEPFFFGPRSGFEDILPFQQRRAIGRAKSTEQQPVQESSRAQGHRAGEVDDKEATIGTDEDVAARAQVPVNDSSCVDLGNDPRKAFEPLRPVVSTIGQDPERSSVDVFDRERVGIDAPEITRDAVDTIETAVGSLFGPDLESSDQSDPPALVAEVLDDHRPLTEIDAQQLRLDRTTGVNRFGGVTAQVGALRETALWYVGRARPTQGLPQGRT